MKLPELLAPAGSMEALRAAVENGADAVYLGGKKFGARQYASNFDLDELAQAVDYTHSREVRIYVTVNTLLDDQELDELPAYLRGLYLIGVDAVIVQDLGVLRVIRKLLPELEVHASTQMTVSNQEGASLLTQEGVKRVVLARELTLHEIATVSRVPGVETEVFVHGALCVCYSGQCLMSSLIGGRSGNRGRCAQPCRLGYSLVDAKGNELVDRNAVGQHLLSPKDIKTIELLPELIKAGVCSLKIEGRMKRPEYVATVVSRYRQALDRLAESEDFEVGAEEERALRQIFNRDFSTAYMRGNPGHELMSYKRPNNRGLFLGRIKAYDPQRGRARIVLDEGLRTGDGIEAWVTRGGRAVTTVDQLWVDGQKREEAWPGEEVTLEFRGMLHPGDRIFKTHDEVLVVQARESYLRASGARRIPLAAHVWANVGQPVVIELQDTEGRVGRGATSDVAQEARNRPLTKEVLFEQLGRLGNTPFYLFQLQLEGDGKAMAPLSQLNEVRRQAVEDLERQRKAVFHRAPVDEAQWNQMMIELGLEKRPSKKTAKQKDDSTVLIAALEGLQALQAAVKAGAQEVYLSTEGYRHEQPFRPGDEEAAISLCRESGVRDVVSLPRLYRPDQRQIVEKIIQRWYQAGAKRFIIANLGYMDLLQNLTEVEVRADFPLWVFNGQSARFLNDLQIRWFTLSPELSLEQIRTLAHHGLPRAQVEVAQSEAVVHGPLPMMVSEYCSSGALLGGRAFNRACNGACHRYTEVYLQDRMNFRFPLYTDAFCRMHLMNAKDLSLLENLPDLVSLGVKRLRIEGRTKSPEWLKSVLNIYRKALRAMASGMWVNDDIQKWQQELERLHPPGYTKGHLFRGVE